MELADRLVDRLAARPAVGGASVAEWRLTLADRRSSGAGMKENRIGGPYNAPSSAHDVAGELYLVWSDGLISVGDLDAWSVDELDNRLDEWRSAAYDDPWRPEVLGPQSLPAVEIYDPMAARLAEGSTEPFFALLEQARSACRDLGCSLVDGGAGASVADVVLRSSHGLDVSFSETSYRCWGAVDDIYTRSWRKRRTVREDEIGDLLADLGRVGHALQRDAQLESGELPVLLTSDTAGAFLNKFLVANLDGQRVVNDQSGFTLADFHAGRGVARSDFSLALDTTVPLEIGSAPCSSEGVAGDRVLLVDRGRLASPMLDLKYARRANMAPTPLPLTGSALEVQTDDLAIWDEVVASLDRGLIVYEILGMHTQDSVSGHFSVVASQALVVRDGVPVGRAKAALTGNFFETLHDPNTRFVRWSVERNPGMLLPCRVAAS